MDTILCRRSVRKFNTTKKVSYEDLTDLCRHAEAAPSARKQSSREYIIVDDQKIIDELSLVSKGSMILSECNSVIAVIGKDPTSLVTPHMQVCDLGAATENILLAATEKGIGSCWIGIYPISERIEAVTKILQLKNQTFPFSLIALGYPLEPNQAFFDSNKFKSNLLHHNRY